MLRCSSECATTCSRRAGRTARSLTGWILEFVDSAGGSTVWEETSQTEQAALSGVLRAIEVEGISCFLLYPVQKLH